MIGKEKEAYKRLENCGLKPSVQRIMIMDYLLSHHTHPTVDEIYKDLSKKYPTLSKTTVYNTLRLFSVYNAAQMITIDEHRVCYDGITSPHSHLLCRKCGRIIDISLTQLPVIPESKIIEDNIIDEVQLYYKGICAQCARRKE